MTLESLVAMVGASFGVAGTVYSAGVHVGRRRAMEALAKHQREDELQLAALGQALSELKQDVKDILRELRTIARGEQ